MKLYRFRIFVQFFVLLLIAAVTVDVVVSAKSVLPWLSRFSPIMTVTTRLSARQWSPYFAGGVLVVFVSLIFPRLFCGWICPLGTCIDITDRLTFVEKRKYLIPSSWKVSFAIFICLSVVSFLRYDIAGFFDPLTITGNIAMAINRLFAKSTESTFTAEFHGHSMLIPGIFLAILTLTVFGRRTWCRFLCPLGGLLGVITLASLYRRKVVSGCIKCGICRKECKMIAVKERFETTIHQSCISCRTCMKACPKKIISIN